MLGNILFLSFCLGIAVEASAPRPENVPTLVDSLLSVDEGYRLRHNSEPLHYDLYLDLTEANFYSYKGSVDIELQILENSQSIYLNSAGLVVDSDSITLTEADGGILRPADVTSSNTYEQIYLEFDEILQSSGVYKLHLEFLNNIGTELKGLYRSSYTIGNITRYIATTHFESTYARTVFPCYDEPAFKATFDVSIRHLSWYHALSNMPIKSTETDDEEMTITRFERTPSMSSYLLAFIVSDFQTLSDGSDRIRVYAPENVVRNTLYAIEFAVQSLEYLESLFGHSFQLPKVDLVAIPDFNMGAMENWGLITFRAVYLIYEEGVTTVRTKQNIADLITHEFVHSWFGNEVTPEWWTYLWLSEGFARYFEYYVTSQIEQDWKLWEQFVVNNVHSALSQDDKSSNRPMSYYETLPDVLNGLFDYVVYAKSASVIRMIQNVIGFDTLKEALTDYIKSRSFQTTKPEYLYASIEKYNKVSLPATVAEIFNSWADNPGYPVVTVTRTGNSLKLSQQRFWMPVDGVTAPSDVKYFIPLNYATSSDSDFTMTTATEWLTPSEPQLTKELASEVGWIIVNKQQTGYYRVNYDSDNWNALTEILNSNQMDTIPVINRAQLVDDASNLAKAGYVSYDVALNILSYLRQETEYIPWSTAYNSLIPLNRILTGDKNYSRFEHFVRNITEAMYKKISLTGAKDHVSRLHLGNTIYLACYFGVEECITDIQDQIKQLTTTSSTYMVPEEIQTATFCAMGKYGISSNDELEAIMNRFLNDTVDSATLGRFITGMGCSRNSTRLDFLLDVTLTNTPGYQLTGVERNQILTAVLSGSYVGLVQGLKFVLEKYNDMLVLYAPLAGVFSDVGNRINTQETLELLQAIDEKYGVSFPNSIKTAVASAIKQGSQNVAWTKLYSESIGTWLTENGYELTDGGASSMTTGIILISAMILINYLL